MLVEMQGDYIHCPLFSLHNSPQYSELKRKVLTTEEFRITQDRGIFDYPKSALEYSNTFHT